MKSLPQTLFSLGAAIVLSSGLAMAQGPGPGPRGGGMGGPRMLNFLSTYLDLTSTQQTQAQTIFTTEQTNSKTVHQQLATQRQAVEAAIQAGQTAAQLTQLTAAEGPLLAQLEANHAIAQSQFYALLTPDQQQKFVALQKLHGPHPGGSSAPQPPPGN